MSKDSSKQITKERVTEALKKVIDPDLQRDLVSLGMIKKIEIKNNDVYITIELTTPACPLKSKIEADTKDVVKKDIPEAENILVSMTANVKKNRMQADKSLPEGVKNIIAVGSGKGGVGKSTVALNLAISLSQTGAKIALLDADIYGPSMGMMMGFKPIDKVSVENDKMIAIEKFGLRVMSFGFFLGEDKAVIWRGPLLNQALKQFLFDVHWGEIDYMLVDLPPGTGDVQISLSQMVPLTGGIIVTTPQNIALLDAGKAAQMFKEINVPILGVIENMSYFQCPNCNHKSHIFSTGGGEKMAKKLDIPLLGEIPLNEGIGRGCDSGSPVAFNNEDSIYRGAFETIAGNLSKAISIQNEEK